MNIRFGVGVVTGTEEQTQSDAYHHAVGTPESLFEPFIWSIFFFAAVLSVWMVKHNGYFERLHVFWPNLTAYLPATADLVPSSTTSTTVAHC